MALILLAVAAATAQTQDDLFNDRLMHELRITIRASDWAALRQNYLDNTYYPAELKWRFEGRDVAVPDVGIRSRGEGSRSPIKPNLRVDFNRYTPGRTFLGLKSVVLKANNQDATMLREQTVFKLWERTGLPVSREAFARLYVNDQYAGVYVITEEPRDPYTERYLGEKGGDLYQYEAIPEGYRFEWRPTCTGTQVACSTDPAKWAPVPFDPEENESGFDITPTINFVRTVNQVSDADFDRTVSGMIDFRMFLTHVAVENYSADFDTFLGDAFGMNNFFLYRYQGTSMHQLLPWDKDLSYSWAGRPIFFHTDENVLMRRTVAIPERRQEYLEAAHKVAVLAGGPGGWLEWEHRREYDQIRQSVYEDTLKQYMVDGVLFPNTNENFENEVVKNLNFISERNSFVLSELAASGLQPGSVQITAVANAGSSESGPLAPGSYASIYGSGLAGTTMTATTPSLPTSLGGVTVYINGFAAPIHFVSPSQINVQVPWELGSGSGSAPFTVSVDGTDTRRGTRPGSPVNAMFSNSVVAAVGPYSPGVFGVTQAGDTLTIYANGLGPVTEEIATGAPAPADRLVRTRVTPEVIIDGQNAEVLFSGMAPGFVGLYQVNVKVQAGVRPGTLIIRIGGQSSSTFSIASRWPNFRHDNRSLAVAARYLHTELRP